MRPVIIALIACITLNIPCHAAEQKQKVYSIVKQYHLPEWYSTQLALWQAEVKQNPKNADAWLNVYMATRMLKLLQAGKTQKDLDEVVELVKKKIPGTFECYFIQSGQDDAHVAEYLQKACELAPNRPETFGGSVSIAEINRDKAREKELCQRWFATNDISAGIYALNYNMLMSCDKDGILFTNGDNDTYPALILQNAKGIRTDVLVLNLYLLKHKDYRDACLKELGLPEFKPASDNEGFTQMSQEICAHIRKNTSRPVYYANTVSPDFYSDVKDNLYCVGLVFKYSKTTFDNLAVLRRNYEQNFVIDNLKVSFSDDISQSVADNLNGTYLTPFLILRQHYQDAGETQAAGKITILITNIAAKTGQTDEVNRIINQAK